MRRFFGVWFTAFGVLFVAIGCALLDIPIVAAPPARPRPEAPSARLSRMN